MKELHFKRGSPVLLTSVNGQLLFRCWPESCEGSEVALPAFVLFKHYTGFQQSVNLFRGQVFEAEYVVFTFIKYRPFMNTEDFLSYLKNKLGYLYIKEGMILHLHYLGCPIILNVQSILSSISDDNKLDFENENISMSTSSFLSLENSFNEQCIITKTFGFHSSTPVSSPRIQTNNDSNNLQLTHSAVQDVDDETSSKIFFNIGPKTRIMIKIPDSEKFKSKYKIEDIAGLEEQIDIIKSSTRLLLNQDIAYATRGLLISGAPGTGKSILIDALQNEYEYLVPVFNIKNIVFCSGIESLKKLQEKIINESPSLILIDDVDKLCENKDLQSELVSIFYKILSASVLSLVIASCQNVDSVPENLRKHGLMDEEIKLNVPSATDRVMIIEKIIADYENDLTNDQINEISDMAHGFTGGDLKRLFHEGYMKAIEENSSECQVTFNHLQKSFLNIKPSSMTRLSFEIPNVKWSDIGGMDEVKEAVKEMVDWPLKYPDKLKRFKIVPPRGILMYGPPGCCKTMIAKALASESRLNFINIKSSQVFNMYVGESEKSVSDLFKKARSAAPCILFLDEVDSLVPVRGSSNGSSNVADRVVTQILVEIDGIDVLEQGVSVIAATNRPERIDPSLLRPGRLDRLIYVPLPDADTRKAIFQVILRKTPVAPDIDLQYLIDKTTNYTGAEISAVCLEASKSALKEGNFVSAPLVSMKHFLGALNGVQPRTTQEMLDVFENYHKKYQFSS